MMLYGINQNVTQDGVISVDRVTLVFYVNGVPAYYSEYRPNFTAKLTEEHKATVKVRLHGPAPIQQIPDPLLE